MTYHPDHQRYYRSLTSCVYTLSYMKVLKPRAHMKRAINRGHDVTYSRVYAGDRLPDDAVGIDFLVVMGGPQDPDTTLEACPHFNAKAEQALIASAVKTGKAVIGICGFTAHW